MNKKVKRNKLFAYLYTLITFIAVAVIIFGPRLWPQILPYLQNELYIKVALCIFIFLNGCFFIHSCSVYEKESRSIHKKISETLGVDIGEAYQFGGIGIIFYSNEYEIIWTSELFEKLKLELLGQNILNTFKELREVFDSNDYDRRCKCILENKTYEIMALKDIPVLILKDVTELEALYEEKKNDAPVIMTISLDNLLDMANVLQDEYANIEQKVRNNITEWAKEHSILIRKIKDDAYLAILDESQYKKIKENNEFDIVNRINSLKIQNKKGVDLTISLGIGRGINDYNKIAELSSNAIEFAHSRGGNQVIVNTFGSNTEIIGESSEQDIRHNILSIKTSAQQFGAMMNNYDKYICVPHLNADFDAIGACLGVYTMAKQLKKKAVIACTKEQMENKAYLLAKKLFPNFDDMFVKVDDSDLDDSTLVVVVDVNLKTNTTCGNLIDKAKNVAIIDHHRRSADNSIEDSIFTLIEPSCSSTCELIALFAKFQTTRFDIESSIATYMLTGILLDTNNLKVRTTFNTYDAIAALKEFGADNVEASYNLKDKYEEYLLKTKILSTIQCIQHGIYYARVPQEECPTTDTTIAKAAQEAFNVEGVSAMFVIGETTDSKNRSQVKISGRSDGTINVQFILEKLGGGGHYSSAAASFKNGETVDEVIDKLIEIIDLHKNEVREIEVRGE